MTAQAQTADNQSHGSAVPPHREARAVDDVVLSVNGQSSGNDVQRPPLLLGDRDVGELEGKAASQAVAPFTVSGEK